MSELLKEKLAELGELGVSEVLCQRIHETIQEREPPALVKLSPFRLAGEWEQPLYETLNAFLFATRLGVFDLEWDLRCPSCTGSTQLVDALNRLRKHSACGYCKIDFQGGFDDAVEVTFRVNSNIREIGELNFLDVVKARAVMEEPAPLIAPPKEDTRLDCNLSNGTWHLFNEGLTVGAPLVVHGHPREATDEVVFTFDGQAMTKNARDFAPGPANVRVVNQSDTPLNLFWARAREFPWVSGSVVASNQHFRDLFSAELIDPDESFSVQSVAFVFTDIKGSTELYEQLGDSQAYALVKDHFTIITEQVKAFQGAVVKTIGDAVMATFTVSQNALEAVLHMHQAFDAFNISEETRDNIIIKVGIHRGPCIAVNSNDRLDYFGRTVNIAARIQGLSTGRDVMVSQTYADEPEIKRVLGASDYRLRPFQAELKGIEDAYDVVQLTTD